MVEQSASTSTANQWAGSRGADQGGSTNKTTSEGKCAHLIYL